MSEEMKLNLLGAITAIAFYASAIALFVLRMMRKTKAEFWIGIFEFGTGLPLLYLLFRAPEFQRAVLYYIQIGCMLSWLIAELILDYILKINFRKKPWMVISYVILFFAGTGGLLGIASYAGSGWGTVSIILFLIMAALAFVQRKVTGK
jgi:hypothetical protein